MSERQMHLFEPVRPLLEKLGARFFKAAPREPGVYIMTDAADRVLYIGQSKNLHARLATYKNARLDSAPRKVLRLVHAVDRVTWEKCGTLEAALAREAELIASHRPVFNRVGTWPVPPIFFFMESARHGVKLGWGHSPQPDAEAFGPFKRSALGTFASVLRLSWGAVHRPACVHDYPSRLLNGSPPHQFAIVWNPGCSLDFRDSYATGMRLWFKGEPDALAELLARQIPDGQALSGFQRAFQADDLDRIKSHRLRVLA